MADLVAQLTSIDRRLISAGRMTALHLAAQSDHADVVQWLIENGAEVDKRAQSQRTALELAAAAAASNSLRVLLAAGAQVNDVRSKDRQSALHLAATHGNVTDIERLLAHGANPLAVDKDNQAPLLRAICGERRTLRRSWSQRTRRHLRMNWATRRLLPQQRLQMRN